MADNTLEITCQQVAKMRTDGEPFVLLDCREQDEYDLVAIEGSELLPMSQIAERKSDLVGKENEQLVVYCHHGMRSLQTVNWLRQQGFSNAVSMAGGIDAWAVEINPSMTRY